MGPNPHFPGVLVTFTKEIVNGKLNFFLWISITRLNLRLMSQGRNSSRLFDHYNFRLKSALNWCKAIISDFFF